MKRKVGIFVDYSQTLVNTVSFYLINPDIFLANLVHSIANFLRHSLKYKKVEASELFYYFLLEEDRRSEKILKRMKKRLDLYVDEDLLNLLVKLSENERYDVKIVSSSSQKIIKGILDELEKRYGRKTNIEIIASSPKNFVSTRMKGEIAKNYTYPKICFVDAQNDKELSKNCEISILKRSLAFYLTEEKPIGYRPGREKFKDVLKLLENKLLS